MNADYFPMRTLHTVVSNSSTVDFKKTMNYILLSPLKCSSQFMLITDLTI